MSTGRYACTRGQSHFLNFVQGQHISLISNSFCPEDTGQTEVKLYTEPSGLTDMGFIFLRSRAPEALRVYPSLHETSGLRFIETGGVTWPRWLPYPYMAKTFKKIFFSRTEQPMILKLGMQHWCSSPTKGLHALRGKNGPFRKWFISSYVVAYVILITK